MPNPFHIVTSRSEFFRQLDLSIAETQRFLTANPTWTLLSSVDRQLSAMKQWTQHGRKPTFDERKSISMGMTVRCQFHGTSDVAWYDYMQRISELANYFMYWRSDAGLDGFDDSDWRNSFPDRYDLSDE
jgi:hypothetical protein